MDNSVVEVADTRAVPLNGPTTMQTSLNETLKTEYVDVGKDSGGFYAQATIFITSVVGSFVTPRTLLSLLRILKAITFCFLILNMLADVMYIAFLHLFATKAVHQLVGGNRDFIIRLYGLALGGIALCIELDVTTVVKKFSGFKTFIARGLVLFFIAAITGTHPINESQVSAKSDDVIDDDGYVRVTSEIPDSAVWFQIVTSFILGGCALIYFCFGLLCFDKFTSKAFLSTTDPIQSTAIPVMAVEPAHTAARNTTPLVSESSASEVP